MALRNLTIGNGVRNFPKGEQTRGIKQNTIKSKSTSTKQNEKKFTKQ